VKRILDLFLSTVSFLTILPVKKRCQNFGYKMFIFFPIVGFMVGLLCYCLYFLLRKFFNEGISVLFAMSFYIFVSDYLHLDGFVDTVDALFGSIKKNYVDILKDPHIGVVGGIYLFIILLAKYFLFLESNKISYILTPVFSRTGLAFAGFFGKKLSDGIGREFLYRNFFITIFCFLCSFILFFLVLHALWYSVVFVILCFLCSFIIVSFFNKKFGGINGDIFGFVNEVLEFLFLIIQVLYIP
jgi:adenosylcobinamide-GDP ribazoletransferase